MKCLQLLVLCTFPAHFATPYVAFNASAQLKLRHRDTTDLDAASTGEFISRCLLQFKDGT